MPKVILEVLVTPGVTYAKGMWLRSVSSLFVNGWQGMGFWSGFTLRNRLIFTLKPSAESKVTEIVLGLCAITSVLVPITATYALVNAARDFRTPEGAALIAAALVVFNVIAFAFYRRVFVWPLRSGAARETAREFEEASFAMLSTKGTTRWKLIGLTIAQIAITVCSFGFVMQRYFDRVWLVYLLVWVPAVIALWLAAATAKQFYAGNDTFSAVDKTLMGVHVSMNLTIVAAIVAGIVIYAAVIAIYVAVLVVGGFILWRAFSARTDPANTVGVFETARSSPSSQWRDTSGATHVDRDGQIREAHTGALIGNVDGNGRVSNADGSFRGTVGGDGQIR